MNKKSIEKIIKIRIPFSLTIFFICIFIASLSWLSVKLSKDYFNTLKVSVEYYNLPINNVIVNKIDHSINITIKTKGYKLISPDRLFGNQTVKIDFSLLMKNKTLKNSTLSISTSQLIGTIKNQLGITNDIFSITPDTLNFKLEQKAIKKVPVIANISYSIHKQYFSQDSIIIKPDSVTISGSEKSLSKITFITTENHVYNNIEYPIFDQILLVVPDSKNHNVTIFPTKVSLAINVEKMSEQKIEVPINTDNEGNKIKTIPENCQIIYKVGLSNIKKVTPQDFTIDIMSQKDENSKTVKLHVIKKPSFVKIVRIEPKTVEYIKIK